MTIAIATIISNNNTDNYYSFCEELSKKTSISMFAEQAFDMAENLKQNPTSAESVQYKCNLLNKLKNRIFKELDNCEHIIYCDSDLLTYPNVLRIIQNCERLEKEPEIAAISSYCIAQIQGNRIYHDIWSLVINQKIQNHKIWTIEEIPSDVFVDSAYGGLIIYYAPVIKILNFVPVVIEGYPCTNFPLQRVGSEFCGMNLQLRQQNLKVLISRNQETYR